MPLERPMAPAGRLTFGRKATSRRAARAWPQPALCCPPSEVAGRVWIGYTPPQALKPQAPVAQLDRALPSEGKGHTFESCRVRQSTNTSAISAGRLLQVSTDIAALAVRYDRPAEASKAGPSLSGSAEN